MKNLIALSNAQPTATDEPIKNGDALYDFIFRVGSCFRRSTFIMYDVPCLKDWLYLLNVRALVLSNSSFVSGYVRFSPPTIRRL